MNKGTPRCRHQSDLDKLLDAALPHVAFDGWSDATFRAAVDESGIEPALAATLAPRGAVDLALAFHRRGDRAMVAAAEGRGPERDEVSRRVATAVQLRLEMVETARPCAAARRCFALPQHAALTGRRRSGRRPIRSGPRWATPRTISTGTPSGPPCRGSRARRCCYWLGDDSRRSRGHMGVSGSADRRRDADRKGEGAASTRTRFCEPLMSGELDRRCSARRRSCQDG